MADRYVKAEHGGWFKVTANGHAVSCEAPPIHLRPERLSDGQQASSVASEESNLHDGWKKKTPRTFTHMGYAKATDAKGGPCTMF